MKPKRYIKTMKQARRIKKIDNVIFEGDIIKEIVDKLNELEKEWPLDIFNATSAKDY